VSEVKRFFYDFSTSPFSYDFLTALCMARSLGCTETVFVPGERDYQKCAPEEQEFRLQNLLIPLARMSGSVVLCGSREDAKKYEPATFPVNYTVDKPVLAHMFGQLIKSGRARWLKPSQMAMQEVGRYLNGRTPVTITIRESRIKPLRNSSIGQWVKAAEWMKERGMDVLFVPDTDNLQEFGGFESYREASLNPDIRLALYTNATLNLGINNGPMAMCVYSSLPYLVFRMHDESFQETSADFLKKNYLPVGSQLPWSRQHQRLVWEDDTAENIIKHFERWEMRRAA
jgi:hypothetical protein